MASNLNQATQRSQQQDMLNQLDNLGSDEANYEDLSSPMEQAAGAFILKVQQSMTDVGMTSFATAADSLQVKIIDETHSQVTADAVLFFMDKGVNPTGKNLYPGTTFGYTTKAPPLAPLLAWIKEKRIMTRNNPKYMSEEAFADLTDDEKQLRMAHAVRYSIFYEKGIKPKDFMDKHVDSYVDDLLQLVMNNVASGVAGKLTFESPETADRGATRFRTLSSPNPNVP